MLDVGGGVEGKALVPPVLKSPLEELRIIHCEEGRTPNKQWSRIKINYGGPTYQSATWLGLGRLFPVCLLNENADTSTPLSCMLLCPPWCCCRSRKCTEARETRS